MNRFRSILSRVVALHVVAIGVISIVMPLALYWLLNEAANSLHRDALRSQAVTIAQLPAAAPDGGVVLDIPPEMEPLYAGSYGLYAYAVLDSGGQRPVLLAQRRQRAVPAQGNARAATGRCAGAAPARCCSASAWRARSAGALYWIQVGQDLSHRDVIIDDIVASFFPRVAWITFPILLVLLLIDIMIFRRALEPVREASTTAAAIGPTRTDVRLPEQAMPTEIVPLVHAVNQAFDRLEAASAPSATSPPTWRTSCARRSPSCAPASIRWSPAPLRDALRADLVNMTRIVNQVLDIAELESFIVAGDARADLQAVCAEAVAFMAPVAVTQSKTIALAGSERPVWVHGHSEALFRAVRNLVENAIRHAPTGGSVEVEVSADGMVRVLDDGPGVPEAERKSIFRRFWRRDRTQGRKPRAWASPSWPASPRPTTAASRSRTGRAAAPSSRCACGPPAGLTAAN